MVAHEVHRARTWVPNRHREDAAQARHDVEPPMLVRLEDDFRVGGRVESLAERLELAAKLLEIVDLAVERDDATRRRIDHRLGAGLAQVEDRKTAVRKHDFVGLRGPESVAVGSSVAQGDADLVDAGHDVAASQPVGGWVREVAHGAGNSTHLLIFSGRQRVDIAFGLMPKSFRFRAASVPRYAGRGTGAEGASAATVCAAGSASLHAAILPAVPRAAPKSTQPARDCRPMSP